MDDEDDDDDEVDDEDDRDEGDVDDEDDDDDAVDEEDVLQCHMFLFPRFHSQRCTLLILAMCATKKFCMNQV